MDSSLPDRTIPGVLDPQERRAVEEQFGVGARQVVRDHVISHGLATIAAAAQGNVVFFGGTALSRTLLPQLRLSEDIDLIALGNRREVGARIQAEVQRRFRRTLGAVTFIPPLGEAPHSQPSILEVKGTRIQVQLLASEGYRRGRGSSSTSSSGTATPSPRGSRCSLRQRSSRPSSPPGKTGTHHATCTTSGLWRRGGWINEAAAALDCRYGPTREPLENLLRRSAKRA